MLLMRVVFCDTFKLFYLLSTRVLVGTSILKMHKQKKNKLNDSCNTFLTVYSDDLPTSK